MATAELLSATPTREVTGREVELWINYMQPAWDRPMSAMKAAFRAWNEAMRREGLIDKNSPELDEFLSD